MGSFCETCQVIVSICPPEFAEKVANQVISREFKGIYLDANAISPHRSEILGKKISSTGGTYVDGGVIGGPAWEPNSTWLHLSGEAAEEVSACFSSGPLETNILGKEIGKASALKMCFAGYTKGTTALLCALLATAEALDVREELEIQWGKYWPDFTEQTRNRVRGVTAKAWRFSGEMNEIAETLEDAGLPGGFHLAANEVYQRLSSYKDASELPSLEKVLRALTLKI
jgi:3-hydroxyisobutyrate dehydrogenase-like beta-hydroxyacid dehydrogenase